MWWCNIHTKDSIRHFWVVTPCSVVVGYHQDLHPEDGGSKVIGKVDILPQHYMASQPRRPTFEISLPWKHCNLHQALQNTLSCILMFWLPSLHLEKFPLDYFGIILPCSDFSEHKLLPFWVADGFLLHSYGIHDTNLLFRRFFRVFPSLTLIICTPCHTVLLYSDRMHENEILAKYAAQMEASRYA